MTKTVEGNLYPWHYSAWQTLMHLKKQNRLAHAYLISGAPGVGKVEFARSVGASLLCQNSHQDGFACGTCSGCSLFFAGSHPGFYWVAREDGGQVIKVDQIRELIAFSQQTAALNGYKVIVLSEADTLNSAAANALLKTLEEPSKKTILFLLTAYPNKLPVTVRSRCQIFSLQPSEELALAWLVENGVSQDIAKLLLNLTNYAPLLALEMYQKNEFKSRVAWFDVWQAWLLNQAGLMRTIKLLDKVDLRSLFDAMLSWLHDLIFLKQGLAGNELFINTDLLSRFKELSRFSLDFLYRSMDAVLVAKKQIEKQPNLNSTLLLESLFLGIKYDC